MITNYNTNAFSDEHIPNVLDVFNGEREIGGQLVQIEIVDTSGDNLLGANRQLVYGGTDCFMLCCAVNNRDSLDALVSFKAEVRSVNSKAPIVLVGTKTDLRGVEPDCIQAKEIEQAK